MQDQNTKETPKKPQEITNKTKHKSTHYTIIQFVPNPIADERINIGIIAYTNQIIKIHHSQNQKRLEQFAEKEKIEFLRDFQQQLTLHLEEGKFTEKFTKNTLEQMIHKWAHIIQFTKPRKSLLEPEPLLKQIKHRFRLT